MTKEQHLLTILAEECVEVAQRVTKALRFGLDETQPGSGATNAERIMDELVDVRVILLMLQEIGTLPEANSSQDVVDKKKAKVNKYISYSEELGLIEK